MTTNKEDCSEIENLIGEREEIEDLKGVESKGVEKKEYRNLVISGGGFNGLQFFGIIKYLDENNLLNNIENYIGVSMGCFINLLLIVGYKINDVETFFIKFDFAKIFDLKFEKILVEENIKGLSSGDNFTKLIKKFLLNKDIDENITLKELYNKTKKNFTIGVTNITYDKMEYINHENYPDLHVFKALRMTSCIPIFFEPIEYKDNYYIDGVMKDNFPIHLVSDDQLSSTIGIVLQTNFERYNIEEMTSVNYLIHLYRVLVNEPMKEKIKKYKELCKLFIIQPKINSFNYQINETNRCDLINSGYEYCKVHFKEHFSE